MLSTPPTKPSLAPKGASSLLAAPLKLPGLITKPSASAPPAHKPKTFSIAPWSDTTEGEKIIIYGKTGDGKTTLASMAPNCVFIGLDDGGRKIPDPRTGQPVNAIPGIASFQDVRDALHQDSLFAPNASLVIDTMTKLEAVMEPHIFQHYPASGGKKATKMRDYGWDGPAHQLDLIRLILSDLDAHVRAGRNVILLAQMGQVTVANSAGLDYLEDGPKLQHNKQYSARTEVCEWADHVLKIGYQDFNVTRENEKQKAGKVENGDATRVIHSGGAPHFIAKSRPIGGNRIPPVIAFATPADDTLWKFIFEGATVA